MAHVFIIDDDLTFLKIVRKILEVAGYQVSSAGDSQTALERIQSDPIDLILTDANMPGGSGFDFVRTLKANPKTRPIPVAMLTSRRNKEDVLKGLECGAKDYIVKPLDPDLFLTKIKTLLDQPLETRPLMDFAEAPVKISARWEIKFEIISVSEKGLTLTSPMAIELGACFVLSSYLFGQMDIARPHLRVTECFPGKEEGTHVVKVEFLGLDEKEEIKIRNWISKNILGDRKVV